MVVVPDGSWGHGVVIVLDKQAVRRTEPLAKPSGLAPAEVLVVPADTAAPVPDGVLGAPEVVVVTGQVCEIQHLVQGVEVQRLPGPALKKSI